jgi:hypothetical protein
VIYLKLIKSFYRSAELTKFDAVKSTAPLLFNWNIEELHPKDFFFVIIYKYTVFSGIFRATDWHTGNNIQSSALRHLSHQIQGTGALLSSLPYYFESQHWTNFSRLVCSRKKCCGVSVNLVCLQEKLHSTLVETELPLVQFVKGRIVF